MKNQYPNAARVRMPYTIVPITCEERNRRRKLRVAILAVLQGPCAARCMDSPEDVEATTRALVDALEGLAPT